MAQSPINIGIKGGYNSSKITTDLDQFDEGSVNNYHAGAFVRINLGKFYLQPEAYFSSKGGELKELGGSPSQTIDAFDLKTVDVPVLLGVNIIKREAYSLRANAGPVMSFFTEKGITSDTFESDNIKNNFFGWQYGVGADILFFTLDLRMENSTGDLYSGSDVDNAKSKSFVVSIGIKLL